jgi:hypothetical protein
LARAIELREHDALELTKNRLPFDYGNKHALTKKQRTEMRCGIPAVAIGKLGRVVLIGEPIFHDSSKKLNDVIR